MQPKLFITDLDGTALGGDYDQYARFPDPFSEFLDELVAAGYRWGINTTWDVDGQWDLIKNSNVKSQPDFLMAEFGRRLAEVTTDGPRFIQPYTDKMAVKLQRFCANEFAALIKTICSRFAAERIFYFGHLFQFSLAEQSDFIEFQHFTEKFFADENFTCDFKKRTLSVRPAFLHKGVPLEESIRHINISPEQIIIAGDEPADIDMMQPMLAKYYICPANAHEKVKEHVRNFDGEIGELPYGAGVIQAFQRLTARHNL